MNTPTELISGNRLKWACRRGMLELDVLLGDFIEDDYEPLPVNDKYLFQQLLAMGDQDLFEHFMKHTPHEDPELNRVIDFVRSAAARRAAAL
jgi:antitoxin CptB